MADLIVDRCRVCRKRSCTGEIITSGTRPIFILRTCLECAKSIATGPQLFAAIERHLNNNNWCGLWTMEDWNQVGFERFAVGGEDEDGEDGGDEELF